MFTARWFRSRKRPLTAAYRPVVCQLEDRTLPSGFANLLHRIFPSPPPGPATHLEVIVPANVQSGKPFSVEVEALDASNHLATGYAGTVHLALSTADAGATIPTDYIFTKQDRGAHAFTVTLAATGSQTIMATDTVTASITGSATTTVNAAPIATHLLVITPEQTTVGTATNITVVALDASGHRVQNYTGTVTLSASDPKFSSVSYTFLATDHGQHTFQATFPTAAAPETVTATGVTTSGTTPPVTTTTITGTASLQVAAAGQVTHFAVYAFGPVVTGMPVQIIVAALDATNHIVTGYTGTVHFTSSDTGATLPGDSMFQASDNGIHTFTVTFAGTGKETLTLADGSATTTVTFNVRSKGASHFNLPVIGFWG